MKLTFILFFSSNLVYCQFNWISSARSLSLANSTLFIEDVNAGLCNPALLVSQTSVAGSLQYENRFGLQDLQQIAAVVSVPFSKNTFSLGIQHFGNSLFRQINYEVATGMKILDNLCVGTNLHLNQLSIPMYGSRLQVLIDVGLHLEISKKISFASTLKNASNFLAKNTMQELAPGKICAGIKYVVTDKVFCLFEISKMNHSIFGIKTACEYMPLSNLSMRLGVDVLTNQIGFGIGYISKKKSHIDLSSSWLPIIGWNTCIGFIFSKNQK
jgi:hypothetical protein